MKQELWFALISTGIYLFGAIPFWINTYKRKTIPHVFSNIIWLILVGFNVYVLAKNHEYFSLIPSILMVLSLSYATIYGYIGRGKILINWFDYLCLTLSMGLLIYWYISDNILSTIIMSVIVDFIAFLPTFKKGWILPGTETIAFYFFAGINQLFTFLAIQSPNWETSLFWGYLFFANLSFFFMVFFRRWYLKGWGSIFE